MPRPAAPYHLPSPHAPAETPTSFLDLNLGVPDRRPVVPGCPDRRPRSNQDEIST